MFIKLTQLDGKSIWFNQAYIVTVEPRRKGTGALVVPLGDGLDYEVHESPESIIEMLGGALKPAALPNASASAAKKSTSSDKNPDSSDKVQASEDPISPPDFRIDGGLIVSASSKPVPTPETGAKPENVTRKKSTSAPKAEKTTSATKAEKKKKTVTRKATAKTVAKSATAKAKKKPALPPLPLTEDQLMRLQKMSPGSLRKLVNTLMSQFAVAETSPVVDALCAREIISITDQGHVNWNWRQVE